MKILNKQSGQVIIVLLLIVIVVLTMVITVNKRTVTDVLTSTQNDQSSKAFSAAEAGIDYARQAGNIAATTIPFGNESSVTISPTRLYPQDISVDGALAVLEYPPIGKETIAHFWLADPNSAGLTAQILQSTILFLYFGNNEDFSISPITSSSEAPAIEVKSVFRDASGGYIFGTPLFIDPNSTRAGNYGFAAPTACPASGITVSPTNLTPNNPGLKYSCYATINLASISPAGSTPILLRVRLLYASKKHRIALKPTGGNNLPPQAKIFTATGTSGKSSKTIQVFSITKVPPFFFDFAIFSTAEIIK